MSQPKPVICLCTDWSIHHDEKTGELSFAPSWRTFGRALGATLLALVLIGAQVYFFGFPPGSAQLSARRDRIVEQDAQINEMRQRARRLDTAATDTGKRMAEQLHQRAAQQREAIERERDRLANAEPTLGAIGDAVYWSFFGLFVLVGVLPPAAACWERITLRPDGRGGVHVVRRGQLVRSHQFAPGAFTHMIIMVERVVHYSREHHHTEDKGWRWAVRLEARDPSQPALVVCPEQEPTLPAQLNKMTSRVRQVVQFLSAVTGVEPGPVVKGDVSNIRPGFFGAKVRGKLSGAGQADLSRHKPL